MQYSRFAAKIAPVARSRTVQTYSMTVLSLATIIILAIFAIRPTVKSILALQKTIDQQKQTLEALRKKSRDLSDGVSRYNQIPQTTKIKLYTLLPDWTNAPCLVNELNAGAESDSLTITGEQLQPTELKGPTNCNLSGPDLDKIYRDASAAASLKEISFTINSQGGFDKLTEYLNSLNSLPRLIDIESAYFTQREGSSLTLTINGKAFFYK